MEGKTFTSASDILAKELSISKSTVKRAFRILRDANLIVAGRKDAPNVRVRITALGEVMLTEINLVRGGK